jgi:hypothetical protein
MQQESCSNTITNVIGTLVVCVILYYACIVGLPHHKLHCLWCVCVCPETALCVCVLVDVSVYRMVEQLSDRRTICYIQYVS